MLKTPLGRFRLVGILEGISFLVLLGIAMPLKYAADMPGPVSAVGAIHGFLFALYLVAIVYIAIVAKWKPLRIVGAVVAAFIPFGPFVLDYRLRRES